MLCRKRQKRWKRPIGSWNRACPQYTKATLPSLDSVFGYLEHERMSPPEGYAIRVTQKGKEGDKSDISGRSWGHIAVGPGPYMGEGVNEG